MSKLVCPKCHSADYRNLSKPLVGRFEGSLGSRNPECYCGWCGWEGRSADLVVDPKAQKENLTADYYAGSVFVGSSELWAFMHPGSGFYSGPGCSG